MNLFVDSNIFLQFYHFSKDDLDELKKLSDLIRKREIVLYVTRQVIFEVTRNRDQIVSDAFRGFRDTKIEMRLPQICRSYAESVTIRTLIGSLKKVTDDLCNKLGKDIDDRTLQADEVIAELFSLATIVESSKYLEIAKVRFDIGNPPGKNNKYGDAINWEALLANLPQTQDLYFVSDDRDFKSSLTGDSFNTFLKDEWEEKKESRLLFYTRLSEFFRNHQATIELRNEEEKNRLIELLSKSPSFASTHSCVASLSRFGDFSDSQVTQIIEAGLANFQINAIAEDADIKSFYGELVRKNDKTIDRTTLMEFRKVFQGENVDVSIDPKSPDDLPF